MDTTTAGAGKQGYMRLFFALWPDDIVRQQLTALMHHNGQHNHGKSMDPANLHLTLVFLGNVNPDMLPCLQQVAADIQNGHFGLQLDTLGWFKKPRVIWVGSRHLPDQLQVLVSQLRTGCINCGLPIEDIPFRGHVTLQRKAQRFRPFDVTPIDWKVEDFVLVQSFTHPEGVEYRVIDRWPLGK